MVVKAKRRGGEARRRRFRPGTVALREIRRYQQQINLLVPRLPFARLVREIIQVVQGGRVEGGLQFRVGSTAMEAMQQATEALAVGLYEDANLAAIHARRVTVSKGDLEIARRLQGDLPGARST